ncbi:ROK family protein [Photobacterium aphoticum]|uniref:Transcriptional regulator n=1 Tax=Photobacterium aphoticum TaxID=754436 RepID=A0A0J1GNW1_9GAMM|nr:ROK family protein [Photobacterium aphoticum]KLV01134.1 transcriptional regulator [Photobacterium aphoticum]PSU58458.1 ROK family protein [Photobacterium aphoticum]GHA37222.1 transcriptional regulator [Photobacterium aphoticum]
MYVAQPGHIDHIKRNNAGSVYKLIDLYGPISRIELSKRSQLAPASITKITRELIDAHLIKETAIQESSSRGRPAIGLVPANEGWQFMSIRLGRGYLTIALHELGGDILVEERQEVDVLEQNEVLSKLIAEIHTFFANHVSELDRITAIAVSLPGLVNSDAGMVLQMPHYHVHNLELGPAIHEATGLPVFVGNDTRSWALAEKLFGNSQDVANSILISIHHGVGAGIVLDNVILQGRIGNVGELGHIQIKPYGKRCFCGNHGCLETVASLKAVIEQVEQRLREGHPSQLHGQSLSIEKICDAAVAGDTLARQVIIELGHHLGQAIAIMVNLFNPEKILIGGEFNRAKDVLYPAIMDCIRTQSLPVYNKDLVIDQSCFYTQATMPGAALVKQAMYDGHLLMKLIEG